MEADDELENMTRIQRSIEFIRRVGVYNSLLQYKSMVENDYAFGFDEDYRKELLVLLDREAQNALDRVNKMRHPIDAPAWQKPMMPQYFRVVHAGVPEIKIPSYPLPIDPNGNLIPNVEVYHRNKQATWLPSPMGHTINDRTI